MAEPQSKADRQRTVFLTQMTLLVHSFPSIRVYCSETPNLEKFNPERFTKFCGDLSDDQAVLSAAFVQSVFDGVDREFDFIAAWKVWDSAHRAAFFRWCHSPFWGEVS